VLVSQGPFLPSIVYVGLFVFPLGGGTLAFGYGRPTQATAGNLEIGPRGASVPGILPTKFGLPRPFRFPSRWRHGTDRQTDRWTDRRTASIHNGASFSEGRPHNK